MLRVLAVTADQSCLVSRLEGKAVRLQEPLDRDESDLSSIVFQVGKKSNNLKDMSKLKFIFGLVLKQLRLAHLIAS